MRLQRLLTLDSHLCCFICCRRYSKELISRGRYAELLAADQRSFTEEEADLFDRAADFAYRSFRDKAAASRGMEVEAMQEVAQGRVWLGQVSWRGNLQQFVACESFDFAFMNS